MYGAWRRSLNWLIESARTYIFKIKCGARSAQSGRGCRFAIWAGPHMPMLPKVRDVIEDRLLALSEAVCTQIMCWFAITHRFLQRIHHRSGLWDASL